MPTLTERAFFSMREKFCAETLNFMQRELFSELNCVFVLHFCCATSRVVLTMRRRRTTFAAAFAKNNERRKKKKTQK